MSQRTPTATTLLVHNSVKLISCGQNHVVMTARSCSYSAGEHLRSYTAGSMEDGMDAVTCRWAQDPSTTTATWVSSWTRCPCRLHTSRQYIWWESVTVMAVEVARQIVKSCCMWAELSACSVWMASCLHHYFWHPMYSVRVTMIGGKREYYQNCSVLY